MTRIGHKESSKHYSSKTYCSCSHWPKVLFCMGRPRGGT